MSSSGNAFKFAKLNGQNYVVWAIHMEDTLSSKYLWMVVNSTEPCPASLVAQEGTLFTETKCMQLWEVQDWVVKNHAAHSVIHYGCSITQ